MTSAKRILVISSDKKLLEVLAFCFRGWGYEALFQESLENDTNTVKRLHPDVVIVDVCSATKAQLEICRLLKDDFLTATLPVITLIDKRHLKTQLLILKRGVDDYLIKPPDPLDLRVRVEMAMRRTRHSFHTSPLTGLPGGSLIEETLNERFQRPVPFSFGYLDIDNFKHFNDVYGYHRGDKVIMQTAYMFYSTIKTFGNKGDFLGHVGGDDFVFITSPDKYKSICHNFILSFDRIMPFHYNQRDRSNSFILARDRTQTMKRVPLMSVSVAIVTNDSNSKFQNVIQMNERITEIKHYLKGIPGSKFMEDRRDRERPRTVIPRIYGDGGTDNYKPLGQRLLDKKMISSNELDKALSIHWRRGVMFGEIVKELGLVREEALERLLNPVRELRGSLTG